MHSEPTQADYAAFFRLGITGRFIQPDEVIAWADQIIRNESDPDVSIIEVSLSNSNPEAMSEQLAIIGEKANRQVVYGLAIQRLGTRLLEDQEQWRAIISQIQSLCYSYEEDEFEKQQ